MISAYMNETVSEFELSTLTAYNSLDFSGLPVPG